MGAYSQEEDTEHPSRQKALAGRGGGQAAEVLLCSGSVVSVLLVSVVRKKIPLIPTFSEKVISIFVC